MMTPISEATPLFDHKGSTYTATEMPRGPWDPRHCHGGPVGALLARAAEQADDGGVDWHVARLTIELTRPVPVLTPLELKVVVERPGRKVSLVGGVLRDGDTEVAIVRALRIRSADVALPIETDLPHEDPMASPESATWVQHDMTGMGLVAFHSHACEHRFAKGTWDEPGPAEVWIRLTSPVVADEMPSGTQSAAAAADFGNGVSGALPYDKFIFINPDLTVYLTRPVQGEWVGMRSASHYSSVGSGLAESALFDANGRVGRSCQSLFVDPR